MLVPNHLVYLWAIICSLGWLLPAKFTRWFDFHSEFWIASCFLVAAGGLLWAYGNRPWRTPMIVLAMAAISLLPIIQWYSGLINLGGHAWLCSLYLWAFTLAVWSGFTWEKAAPGQSIDALFAAILMAGIATVALQFTQWRSIASLDAWWVIWAEPTRPNGNFGQANLAATLLCWGLCATGWFTVRRRMPWFFACALAAVLLFGIALSNSRTAFLGLLISLVLVFSYRRLWDDKRTLWFVAALAIYFLACVFFIQWINDKEFDKTVLNSGSLSARFEIWSISMEAIRDKPWFGYGWSQTYAAQVAVTDRVPAFHQAFNSAHNLVFDLILWNGIPLAALLLGGMGLWLIRRYRNIDRPETFILGLCIVFIANHSMLEYPVHYAFFLLPLGWLIGAFEAHISDAAGPGFRAPRSAVLTLLCLMAALLAEIKIEYLMIDDAHRIQTLKGMGQTTEIWKEPKARVLGHLVSQMKLEQLDISQKRFDPAELQRLEDVALFAPGASPMVMVAGALAMNGQPERARWWLLRICKITSEQNCSRVQSNWNSAGQKHPEIAAIAWPDNTDDTKPN